MTTTEHSSLSEIELMIQDCLKRYKKLSDWEYKFLDSLSTWEHGYTTKQIERLEAIWERVT